MTNWTKDELDKIGKAEELQVSALRMDGTLRNWVTVWVVRLADDLYIRSVKGCEGAWYRGTQLRHEGRIQAGGIEKDVHFEDIDDAEINAQVDAAYLAKYRRYPSDAALMVKPEARSTTIRLAPR